ncbi:MAG: DUF2244 domain-containing protein [Motiliproteus sp.]|nr:DUF2244 domain-containing protein [Motiliproteus sp.]
MIRQEGVERPSQPVFEALLYPHRSLSPNSFIAVMLMFGIFSVVLAIYFLLMGAWPVSGFLGLDILLLYWAFKSSFADGEMQEVIRLEKDRLTVKRASVKAETQCWEFNPFWVQVRMEKPSAFTSRLALAGQGQHLVIGHFLTSRERQTLAETLQEELARQKSALMGNYS